MATAVPTKSMTVEEFLALPDDGIERWLIDGQLREGDTTVRSWAHSRILIRVGRYLDSWNDSQPQPRGQVVGGEAGFRLKGPDDTAVGVDVAYISAEAAAGSEPATSLICGAPVLAVEILSPSDKHQDIVEKIEKYLSVGTHAVWIIDPNFHFVRVHQVGQQPQQFNTEQTLTGDYLPGFTVPVAELFR